MGPPGPLLENGAAGFYQVEQEKPIIPGWPGDAMPRMMGWNFDWEIGNELEDGIKERKNAGIVDLAIHSESSTTSTSTFANGQSDRGITNHNNIKTSTTAIGETKEEYQGPTFPPLPIRPAYDAHQAIQQREQERREEEAEFQFQEVQEDKEIELLAIQAQKKEAEEGKERERLRAVEEARIIAEQQELERKKLLQEKELADKKAKEHAATTTEKAKPLPKFSFSLKLGSSTSKPPPTAMPSAQAAPTPSAVVAPSEEAISQALTASTSDTASHEVASTPSEVASTALVADQGAPVPSDGVIAAQQPGTMPESSKATSNGPLEGEAISTIEEMGSSLNTMWTPGIPVQQDYRALAADISSLSLPPIVLPSFSAVSHIELEALPSQVLEPVTSLEPVIMSPAEEIEDAEGDAEGEEDAENESEDDLFDEVEVDDKDAARSMNAVVSGAFPPPPPVVEDSGMHVEVEEMNM